MSLFVREPMPELPEVEVTRRSFADRIASAHILAMHMGKPLRWPLGVPAANLIGRQIWGVRRRGKYLLLDLDQGLLLVHLGMSGSLNFAPTQSEAGPHDHMDLVTDRGVLRLHDPRRFGAVVWAPGEDSPQAQKLLGRLGVEPLSAQFDVAAFAQALKKRQSASSRFCWRGMRWWAWAISMRRKPCSWRAFVPRPRLRVCPNPEWLGCMWPSFRC